MSRHLGVNPQSSKVFFEKPWWVSWFQSGHVHALVEMTLLDHIKISDKRYIC